MQMPTLTSDMSLSDLRREVRYTLAVTRARSYTASQVAIFEARLKEVAAAEGELATLQDKLEDAQAAIDEADQQLDVFVLDTVPDAREAVGKDTDAPLWKALFGDLRPSEFVRPKLGDELQQLRRWPELLKASSNVALQGRVATCEKLLKAADAAIAGQEAAQTALKVFRGTKVPALLDRVNASRHDLGNLADQQVFAGKLRPEEVEGLFRRTSRGRQVRPETLEQLQADIAETEQQLAEQHRRLKVLQAEREQAQQKAAARVAQEKALQEARALQAEAAAKIASLESLLKQ
jgi:chromosome segregation ATPase